MEVKTERERRIIALMAGVSVFAVMVTTFADTPSTNPACLPQMNIIMNQATAECKENPTLEKAGIGIASFLGGLGSLAATFVTLSIVKVKPVMQKES